MRTDHDAPDHTALRIAALSAPIWITLLALAALFFAARTAHGAPVPPPPRLAPELLVGTWRYEYGGNRNGVMDFYADGTYVSYLGPDTWMICLGRWYVEGGEVVLIQHAFCMATGVSSGPNTYRFTFDMRDYPTLAGTSNGIVPVRLCDPQR